MVFALSNNRNVIDRDDIEMAELVVNYLTNCTRHVARMIGQSDYSAVLERIVEIVAQKTPIGGCKPGEVSRALSSHQRSVANDRGGVAQLLKNLEANEEVHRLDGGSYINTEQLQA